MIGLSKTISYEELMKRKMIRHQLIYNSVVQEIQDKWKARIQELLNKGFVEVFIKPNDKDGKVYYVKVSDHRIKAKEWEEIWDRLWDMFPNVEHLEFRIGNSWYE